jgi:hypothetical protein
MDTHSAPLTATQRAKLEAIAKLEASPDQKERDHAAFAKIIILAKDKGTSDRDLAKSLGWSETSFRRLMNIADGRAEDGQATAPSNDASPPLEAILRNLPKLTADERELVRKELDILSAGNVTRLRSDH